LVLFNGCFTLPVINEQLPSSTFSSLYHYSTTGKTVNLRLVSDDEETAAQELRTLNQLSTSEPITSTYGQSFNHKRDHDDLSFTTVEPITQVTKLKQRSLIREDEDEDKTETKDDKRDEYKDETETKNDKRDEDEDETETKDDKREMKVELTTSDMLLFTSTSSAVAPEFYTSESSTSTSTEKYASPPENENEHEHRSVFVNDPVPSVAVAPATVVPVEPAAVVPVAPAPVVPLVSAPETERVQIHKSEHHYESESEQTKDIDDIQRKSISELTSTGNSKIVTGLPDNMSTSTMEYKKEQKPLNQGKESLHTEEKKPNH